LGIAIHRIAEAALLDRIGAQLPLIVGPTIAAFGFALLALSGPTTS
jgi:hypothetical protein